MTLELNIRRERFSAFIITFSYLVTNVILYYGGPSYFILILFVQLPFLLFSCLVEYVVLWMTTDDKRKGMGALQNYVILILIVLGSFGSQIAEVIIGMDDLSYFPQTIFFTWTMIITWFLGKVIVRQIYILKPPTEIRGFSGGPEEDNNTRSLSS
ncbi:MAG: hypothetical protein ACXAAO_12610 [Candidatus Thorarchaeota archaeon]|jgi:hypothetical protein